MNCDYCHKPLESGKYSLFDVRWPELPDVERKHVHPECKAEFEARMDGEGAEVELVENVDEWTPGVGR